MLGHHVLPAPKQKCIDKPINRPTSVCLEQILMAAHLTSHLFKGRLTNLFVASQKTLLDFE